MKRGSKPITHGTESGYTRHCRCPACTTAHRNYARAQKVIRDRMRQADILRARRVKPE